VFFKCDDLFNDLIVQTYSKKSFPKLYEKDKSGVFCDLEKLFKPEQSKYQNRTVRELVGDYVFEFQIFTGMAPSWSQGRVSILNK